ncbi:hypothetical protein [Amorphus coralli]|uniref:hypothetical protein n=1 Tax=Amorphus coralli TaxID=340680 RepID=UPI0004119EBE|nr:hypothetical protein [Amorphus coralli]
MAIGINEGIGVFNGMVSAAKAVRDGVRKISGDIDQEMRNALNTQIGDLIDAMQDMRERYTAMFNRLCEIEEENRQLRDFQIDVENYVLDEIGPQSFAYSRKTDSLANEAKPHLCAHCFDRKVKSILQFECHKAQTDVLKCNACGSTVHKTANRESYAYTPAPLRRALD